MTNTNHSPIPTADFLDNPEIFDHFNQRLDVIANDPNSRFTYGGFERFQKELEAVVGQKISPFDFIEFIFSKYKPKA